jgi:hypothetical protein
MRDHPHNTGNLVGPVYAPDFAFCADTSGQASLVRFEDGRLMQADSRRMYTHVREDDVWVQ